MTTLDQIFNQAIENATHQYNRDVQAAQDEMNLQMVPHQQTFDKRVQSINEDRFERVRSLKDAFNQDFIGLYDFQLKQNAAQTERDEKYAEILAEFDQAMEPHRTAFKQAVELANDAWRKRVNDAHTAWHKAWEIPASEETNSGVVELDIVSAYPSGLSKSSGQESATDSTDSQTLDASAFGLGLPGAEPRDKE